MCKSNDVVCEIISSVDDAIKMRTKYQNLDMGVFFIFKLFGRGLDPKLKKDAFVCIYEGACDLEYKDRVEAQFTVSDVLQIFGRSSRQQDQGKGSFYMIGDPTGGVDGWNQIKARSASRTDDGGKVLRLIYDKLKKVDVKQFLSSPSTVEAISDCNWQMNPVECEKKFRQTYGMIKQ